MDFKIVVGLRITSPLYGPYVRPINHKLPGPLTVLLFKVEIARQILSRTFEFRI